jgi:hypothetical protein
VWGLNWGQFKTEGNNATLMCPIVPAAESSCIKHRAICSCVLHPTKQQKKVFLLVLTLDFDMAKQAIHASHLTMQQRILSPSCSVFATSKAIACGEALNALSFDSLRLQNSNRYPTAENYSGIIRAVQGRYS